jgi:DNA-binding HxlR family transcriptional regulator
MPAKKGYRQFCPVAKASEILAERWTFLVVRELLSGSNRFNDIRKGVPTMSPSLLSQRLKELERSRIITRDTVKGQTGAEYRLTQAGEELRPIVERMGVWGLRWVHHQITKEDLDPSLLMWDIRRGMRAENLPPTRTVFEFDFGAAQKKMRNWWLVTENGDVDLCMISHGFDVNVMIETDVRTLADVWLGQTGYKDAMRDGKLQIDGPRALLKTFPEWFGESAIATAAARMHM